MSGILSFTQVVSLPTYSTSFNIYPSYTSYNPLSNSSPTTSNWYYYLFNLSSMPSSSETSYETISMIVNTITTIDLNRVVMGPGGSAGASPAQGSSEYGSAYGGGGGGAGVSLSKLSLETGTSLYITFGAMAPSNEPSDYLDSSFSYNNNTVSAGVGSYGYSCTTYSSSIPNSNNIGGNGGNGSNTTTLSTNPYGSFAGGAGGNGGTGTYKNGTKGQSYNGATSGSVGATSPGYTTITMADGTTANVATAGSEGESGNQPLVLIYFQYTDSETTL